MKYNTFLKNAILITLIFVFLLTFISIGSASSSNTIQVDVLKYEPYPSEIGEFVSVWVKVDNKASTRAGTSVADDVTIELIPEFPFSLDSPDNAKKNFGTIPPGRTGIHEYRLYVDDSAKPDVGTIKIRYQAEEGGAWLEESFDIRVGTDTFDSRGTLELVSSQTEPNVLMPGDTGTVILEVRNSATERTVVFDGEEYDTNARIQAASLSSNENIQVISDSYRGDGVLGPGDKIRIHYTIELSEDAPVGTHLVEFSMLGSSHSYNTNWQIPIKVDSQSSLKVIPSNSLTLENGEGTLEFDVANIHSDSLSGVSVRLESDDLSFSPSEYFIGGMDTDELFTIDIDANQVSNAESPYAVDVIASYRNGPNNHEYLVNTIEVREVDAPSNAVTWLILVVFVGLLAGAGVVYYKKKMKNSENGSKDIKSK